MTAQKAIEQALIKLGVIAKGEPAQSEELADGLVMLNGMLAQWAGNGLMLPVGEDLSVFDALDSVSDTIPLPSSYDIAIIYNLAILLAPDYNKPPSPVVTVTANNSIRAIKRHNSAQTPQDDMVVDYGCPGTQNNYSAYDITEGV